jgi:hypothetical protein
VHAKISFRYTEITWQYTVNIMFDNMLYPVPFYDADMRSFSIPTKTGDSDL